MTQLGGRARSRPGGVTGRARPLSALLVVVLVLVLAVLVVARFATGRLVAVLVEGPGASRGSPVTPAAVSPELTGGGGAADGSSGQAVLRAARVLHAWDADRATAYARGDPVALRRLYTPGSVAAARDLRVLRAYAERGLVVRDLAIQVLSLRVLAAEPHRLRLVVTDRRVGGCAVARTGRPVSAVLPQDAPSTRVLVLRHRAGRWQVSAVRDA